MIATSSPAADLQRADLSRTCRQAVDRGSEIGYDGSYAPAPDSGGVYIVPAFSGLFAPYWQSDARGVIVGLTRFINRNHLCRAALEATAYQTL